MSKYTTMNGAKIAFSTPMKMKRLLSLRAGVNCRCRMAFLPNYSPVNQGCSILALQEHLPHPSPSIKQVFHQTKLKIPLKSTRERPAFALLCRPLALEWHTQVKELFVKKRDEEIFLSHDTVGDIVRVQFSTLAGTWTRRRGGEFCKWIGITDSSNASDDFRPRDRLDIFLEYGR
jgi:hypothetical protein